MKITAGWIVGFFDGDGHFGCGKTSVGSDRFYCVVSQNKRSVSVLYEIKSFFKCGLVQKAGQDMMEYKVTSKKHLLEIIIPFFETNPLKTWKLDSFHQFIQKIKFDSHALSEPRDNKLLSTSPFNRHLPLLTHDWLLGFIDAEASFVCSIIGKTIRPQMIIGLKSEDKQVLDAIQALLNCGVRYARKNGVEIFQLSSNRDMLYFVKHYLQTSGSKDRLRTEKRIRARKWSQIILLMSQKKHETIQGFEKIERLYKSF